MKNLSDPPPVAWNTFGRHWDMTSSFWVAPSSIQKKEEVTPSPDSVMSDVALTVGARKNDETSCSSSPASTPRGSERYGELEQVILQRDEVNPGRSKGYGFIQFFRDRIHAKEALSEMNGFELAGRQIRVGLGNDKFNTMAHLDSPS
ncbi:hypothetical protein CC86DRAFT_407560 [Ophiobolus disseminans]|uniref:RRM domain-containing protein n=1 Tax=Ophiobolus disseminans TaxID=1469910 RepID=A0A6A6ZY63_9PLEO|nr:hypothetical protein CC86DRAFT_407560 [Ophiobolus disseminans]